MPSVAFKTLGCKLNQAETAHLTQQFLDRGYTVISDADYAEVVLINTCTVTGRSDSKCRQMIRQIGRNNPDATLLVTGCLAQLSYDELSEMEGVDYVLGTSERFHLFRYFPGPGKQDQPVIHTEMTGEVQSGDTCFQEQTRAFLKIQDGCSRFCSYCIVPYARGPRRSVAESLVLKQAARLIAQDHKEIVLTGVHIGDYGRDSGEESKLPQLLHSLIELDGLGRLRLSSLDPEDVSDDLLEVVQSTDKICRHFHIPLQSGSDVILRSMGRSVDTRGFEEKIQTIRETFPHAGIGTDIIAGFPGETDALFEETREFVESLPFTYFHVFPFSRRKGTKAYELEDRVHSATVTERTRILREIGEARKREFNETWVGKTAEVLIESKKKGKWMEGFSSEYLRVKVPYDAELQNALVTVRITEADTNVVSGHIA